MKKQLCMLLSLACAAWQGTAAAQIEISTLTELQAIGTDATTLSEAYVLVNDIDASATSSWNSGKGFRPIGDFTNRGFSGTFDGQGHVISNLYINRPDESNIGLFGALEPTVTKAVIKNTGLENATVIGLDWVGGLAGEIWGADGYEFHEITNCYTTGMVSGRDYVGGLIGDSDYGFIADSYSSAAVSGQEYVGGLISVVSYFAAISTCYSTGAVSGEIMVGGLVGSQLYSYGDIMTSPIDNCYSTGAVHGQEYVGGLVGKSFDCDIINSYSTGPVAGTGDNVGGFVGATDHSFGGSIAGCFWDTQTSGQSSAGVGDTGGAVGKTTAEMKTKSTFTDAGWDFSDIWVIINDVTYPFFLWENNEPVAAPDSFATRSNTVLDVTAASGVLANDSDADGDSLQATLVATTANGSLALHGDGSFTYTPNTDFTGIDSFTYQASDGAALSVPASVTIAVTSHAITAGADSYKARMNTTLTVAAPGVLANDSDELGHSLGAELVTTAASGTLVLGSDGAFTYTPNTDFTGTDSFTYRATDGGGISVPATVTIEVQCLLAGIYGQHAAETELLRRYRDEVLAKTPAGRALIGLYYYFSPVFDAVAARKAGLGQRAKKLMDKVLPAVRRRLEG